MMYLATGHVTIFRMKSKSARASELDAAGQCWSLHFNNYQTTQSSVLLLFVPSLASSLPLLSPPSFKKTWPSPTKRSCVHPYTLRGLSKYTWTRILSNVWHACGCIRTHTRTIDWDATMRTNLQWEEGVRHEYQQARDTARRWVQSNHRVRWEWLWWLFLFFLICQA